MSDPSRDSLKRARFLIATRRYAEAAGLLEPLLPLYRDSSEFYRTLGKACLGSGDSGGAFTYLSRAEQLKPGDSGTLADLAELHAGRGEPDKAAALCLRILDDRPGERRAKRLLSSLREPPENKKTKGAIHRGESVLREKGIHRTVTRALLITAAALVVMAVIVAATTAGRDKAPGTSALNNGAAREYATGVRRRAISVALKYSEEGRFVDALKLVNGILYSPEAAPSLRAESLDAKRSILAVAGSAAGAAWSSMPGLKEVLSDPRLYDGCRISWAGLVSNLEEKNAGSEFDLLVGSDGLVEFEGVAHVIAAVAPLAGIRLRVDGTIEFDGAFFAVRAASVSSVPAEDTGAGEG
ncbi:MAG: tetratricopeptide repeat protein [Rectinemataceae bacterium]